MKRLLVLSLFATTLALHAQFPEPNGGTLERGTLPRQWQPAGPKCMEIPEWQVHEYNPTFFILRQSGCTDYEKPFVYLIFGQDKALLFDTGSRNGNIVPTLTRTIHNWLERNERKSIPLVVTHSHNHGDHTAGDKDIQAMTDPAIPITFLAAKVEDEKAFFQISDGPDARGLIDLGQRTIDVIPIPGHEAAAIALYDRKTGILLTGDSLYPGRLYIRDFTAFQASTERLVRFTADKPIAHILGCHVEQSRTPFLDYPIGTIYQPDEHPLELSRGTLLELSEALKSLNGTPRRLALRDLTLWPSLPRTATPGAPPPQRNPNQNQAEQLKKKWDQTTP